MLACISPPARFHVTTDDVHYHTLYVTHSNRLDSVTTLKYELVLSQTAADIEPRFRIVCWLNLLGILVSHLLQLFEGCFRGGNADDKRNSDRLRYSFTAFLVSRPVSLLAFPAKKSTKEMSGVILS